MAFNEFQLEELKKIEGFGKAYEAGEKTAAGAMGDIALIMIPGMGTVKLARTGGKLTQSAMDFVKRAKKMYPNAKVNPTPTATQVSNAKPISGVTLKKPADVAVSALKPRPRATAPGGKPTTTAAPKPKVRVPAGTAAKPAPKATTPKPSAKPAAKPKPKAKPNAAAAKKRASAQRDIDTLLAAAVGAGAVGAVNKAIAPTKPKADTKKDAPKKRAKPGGTNKGADPKKAKPKARGPQTRGSVAPQKTTPRASGPSTRGGAKRGATKIVTAGKNVGFGPKGNIFPKDAADRRRLMAKYGGTGSAAAKAAAAGKQGNLKKKK